MMTHGASVTLAGYAATEPVVRNTKDGVQVTSLRLASTPRWVDRATGQWRDGQTSFYSVSCFGRLGANVASSLRKGQAIVVIGRLHISQFEDREGRRRSEPEVRADVLGFDLNRGVSSFTPNSRAAADPDGLARGEAIRSGLAAETGPEGMVGSGADRDAGLLDEQAVSDLERDLDVPAPEPVAS